MPYKIEYKLLVDCMIFHLIIIIYILFKPKRMKRMNGIGN